MDNFDFMDAKKEDKDKILIDKMEGVTLENKMFYPNPLPPFVQKTRDDIVIDTCLDVFGLRGEDRTIAEMQIKYRLGIWEKPPCER